MTTHYALQKFPENYATAMGKDLPISTKQSIEICKYIRGKSLQRAKKILEEVMEEKQPIPFTRFTTDLGHKPGIGSGRYPYKASMAILSLLKSVEANAQVKGLSTNNLVIYHISANKASTPWRYGRKRRVKAKRTHVEVVVAEKKLEEKAGLKKGKKEAGQKEGKATAENKEASQ